MHQNHWLPFSPFGMEIDLKNLFNLSGMGIYVNKIIFIYPIIYLDVDWWLKSELSLQYFLELLYTIAPETENFSSL